jgi:hypothetical protein
MTPRIDHTRFGSVTLDGKAFEHDVVIQLGGKAAKRKKRLSKAVYGTSHTISLAFKRNSCRVELLPTPAAIQAWNAAEGTVIGLLHVTC